MKWSYASKKDIDLNVIIIIICEKDLNQNRIVEEDKCVSGL